jgi:hypothetical protein
LDFLNQYNILENWNFENQHENWDFGMNKFEKKSSRVGNKTKRKLFLFVLKGN